MCVYHATFDIIGDMLNQGPLLVSLLSLLLLLTACPYSADTLAPKTYLSTRDIHYTDNLILAVSYFKVSNKRTCSVKTIAENQILQIRIKTILCTNENVIILVHFF